MSASVIICLCIGKPWKHLWKQNEENSMNTFAIINEIKKWKYETEIKQSGSLNSIGETDWKEQIKHERERERNLELSRFDGDRDADEEDAEHSYGCVTLPVLRSTVRATGHTPNLLPEISIPMISCSTSHCFFWLGLFVLPSSKMSKFNQTLN